MRNILLIAFFVAVTGCASSPEAPKTTIVKWERLQLGLITAIPDGMTIFALVFKDKGVGWFDKRTLENESEYRQRLAKAGEGLMGREVIFLIPQDACDVKADPDALTYSIRIKESLGSTVTAKKDSWYGVSRQMQNAFGAQMEVRTIHEFEQNLDIGDFEKLPSEVQMGYKSIGIVMRFAQSNKDSDAVFRQWIAEKRVGFAIRGKIGDIAKARNTRFETTPTLDSPRIVKASNRYMRGRIVVILQRG